MNRKLVLAIALLSSVFQVKDSSAQEKLDFALALESQDISGAEALLEGARSVRLCHAQTEMTALRVYNSLGSIEYKEGHRDSNGEIILSYDYSGPTVHDVSHKVKISVVQDEDSDEAVIESEVISGECEN